MAAEGEQPVGQPGFEWRDYLTPVVGLVVIIAIVIGIFSAIRGLTARKTQEVAEQSQVEEGQEALPTTEGVPSSQVSLGEEGQAQQESSPAPAEELPKTGFPGAAVAALSAVLAGVGFKLRRIRKI